MFAVIYKHIKTLSYIYFRLYVIISCKLAHKLAFLNQERVKNRMGMGILRHYVTVSKTACPRFKSLYPRQNADRPHSYAVCFHSYTFFTRFYLKFQLRVHFRADINANIYSM